MTDPSRTKTHVLIPLPWLYRCRCRAVDNEKAERENEKSKELGARLEARRCCNYELSRCKDRQPPNVGTQDSQRELPLDVPHRGSEPSLPPIIARTNPLQSIGQKTRSHDLDLGTSGLRSILVHLSRRGNVALVPGVNTWTTDLEPGSSRSLTMIGWASLMKTLEHRT